MFSCTTAPPAPNTRASAMVTALSLISTRTGALGECWRDSDHLRLERSAINNPMKILWGVAIVLGTVAMWLSLNYNRHNLETAEVDDGARKSTPGQYVKIPAGVVHYELAGPADGRIV